MYLARLGSGAEAWVQAAVAIGGPPRRADGDAFWDEISRRLSAAALVPRSTVARRIILDTGGRLRQTFILTAPAEHEGAIRRVVAGLTRLERAAGGSVALSQGREEHDRWMEPPGRLRYCPTAEGFFVQGVPLACDFRVAGVLDDLLVDASLGGYTLVYQVHVRAAEIDLEDLRAARRNALALHDLPGARPALVEWQEQLARAFGYAGAFCEEYLAVDTPEAAAAASLLLGDRFRACYGPLGFPGLPGGFAEGAHDEPLAVAVHSHDLDPASPTHLCGMALGPAERAQVLGWRPSLRLLQFLVPPASDGGENATTSAGLPLQAPYTGEGPYAFLSYKREDLPRVRPILEMVHGLGMPVWYDLGIPGGAEWDEVIEDRVANARLVLFCISDAAVGSKHVRREVKLADALDVPLLGVLLEDGVQLRHGLRMLVTPHQVLNAGSPDFAGQLRHALRHLAAGG